MEEERTQLEWECIQWALWERIADAKRGRTIATVIAIVEAVIILGCLIIMGEAGL